MFDKNYIKKILIDNGDQKQSKVVLWNGYKSNLNEISLLNYIDENSAEIKSNYIDNIESLSNLRFNEVNKLSDYFVIKNDFSLWWTTHIYEKSFYKQSTINDVLKLIALKKLLIANNTKNLYLEASSKKVSECINDICDELKINFTFKKKFKISKNSISFKEIIKFFTPQIIFSFLNFIRFLSKRILFKKKNMENLRIMNKENLFCTYFNYIDFKKLNNGFYSSDYWSELIKNKQNKIKNSIFLHIYPPNVNVESNFRSSVKHFERINEKKEIFHLFIDELFDRKIFIKIIKQWFTYLSKYKQIKNNIHKQLINNNDYSFYLLKNEIKEALTGTDALINLYYFFLFEKLSKLIKKPKRTFYLFENQGWEKSFVYNFKKLKSKVIAITHATTRFWDLRFSYSNKKEYQNFLPDFYAANGDDTFKKFIVEKFPKKKN